MQSPLGNRIINNKKMPKTTFKQTPQDCFFNISIDTNWKKKNVQVEVSLGDPEQIGDEEYLATTTYNFRTDEISIPEIMKVIEMQVQASISVFGSKYEGIKK